MGKPPKGGHHDWLRIALWATLILALLPLVIAAWIVQDILRSKSTRTSPGLLQQVFGYWIGIKLWHKNQICIRDVRVRESSNRIYLVRLYGELVGGDLTRGDMVTIYGEDCGGTLHFVHGTNHTLRALIQIQ
jgi:hypothetical protein